MADVAKINLKGMELNIKDTSAREDIKTINNKKVIKAEYVSAIETITISKVLIGEE